MKFELYIQNGSTVYEPAVEDEIEWSTERKGSPGKLAFKVVQDSLLDIQEGNAVQFKVDGKPIFYGYIFKKAYDKDKVLSITCYDQLRYFKNKDTYVYMGKKASELLQMICSDFKLKAGDIADTGYIIPKKSEPNKTLFDIVQNALTDTMMNTRKIYVLFDFFGSITLKSIGALKVPIVIDEETGENFDYTSSIDSDTYDKIKLVYEDKGVRNVYITQDGEHMNQWGILQYYDMLKEGENGAAKADNLLKLYNQKTKNLSVKGAFGDLRVRAGAAPLIKLKLGDMSVNNFMLCEKATHKFKNNEHTMNLTLVGGEFIA